MIMEVSQNSIYCIFWNVSCTGVDIAPAERNIHLLATHRCAFALMSVHLHCILKATLVYNGKL